MFSKILIANRGEIAVRIIRSCKEMGIATVAVFSKADADMLHVALADQSYCIGEALAADSYLNEERIIAAALTSGAQAIHPGYGFLSESSHFASLCLSYGIAFIGPSVNSMEKLSDKERVKSEMENAGLPVIRGSEILADIDSAYKAAKNVGYPVMIKARSGGGGRGIRLVTDETGLENAYHSATAEAKAAFGDGAVYLEKYISPARHIEMQIIADEYGNVVCLGERDCSIQRNHQKLLEESPSPAVSHELRQKMVAEITQAIQKIGYEGLGTLEFLLDQSGHYYFMEMNVRLQVEHTVTESLIGMDLVKWQIRVAAGIPLSFTQDDIDLDGAAIECRINAKSPGVVSFLHIPGGPFVRFDTYLAVGSAVSPLYDPLLGKLIVYASSREETLRKLKAAMCELDIQGVANNIEEQLEIIDSDYFQSGDYKIG